MRFPKVLTVGAENPAYYIINTSEDLEKAAARTVTDWFQLPGYFEEGTVLYEQAQEVAEAPSEEEAGKLTTSNGVGLAWHVMNEARLELSEGTDAYDWDLVDTQAL